MIKSIWEIGEDGSRLGWNVVLEDVCYEKLVSELTDDEQEQFDYEEYGGAFYILEDDHANRAGVDWDELVKESDDCELVTYEVLLAKVKEFLEWHREDYEEHKALRGN